MNDVDRDAWAFWRRWTLITVAAGGLWSGTYGLIHLSIWWLLREEVVAWQAETGLDVVASFAEDSRLRHPTLQPVEAISAVIWRPLPSGGRTMVPVWEKGEPLSPPAGADGTHFSSWNEAASDAFKAVRDAHDQGYLVRDVGLAAVHVGATHAAREAWDAGNLPEALAWLLEADALAYEASRQIDPSAARGSVSMFAFGPVEGFAISALAFHDVYEDAAWQSARGPALALAAALCDVDGNQREVTRALDKNRSTRAMELRVAYYGKNYANISRISKATDMLSKVQNVRVLRRHASSEAFGDPRTRLDALPNVADAWPQPPSIVSTAGRIGLPDVQRLRHFRSDMSPHGIRAGLALAVRVYRADHRHPPARLEDLVPDYLPALPDDTLADGTGVFGRYDQAGGLWQWLPSYVQKQVEQQNLPVEGRPRESDDEDDVEPDAKNNLG